MSQMAEVMIQAVGFFAVLVGLGIGVWTLGRFTLQGARWTWRRLRR